MKRQLPEFATEILVYVVISGTLMFSMYYLEVASR